MENISFSAIGLNLKINKIAINIFGIDIYWYAILIVIAFIIAILLCKLDDKKYNIKFEDILKLLLIVLPVSIIFARLYFILFNFAYYKNNLIQVFNIRNGGLAIYGGIIGAVIVIAWYSKKNTINFLDLLDYVVPYLALGQAIGRWGNFFNTEAYGIETNIIFRMGIIQNGKYIEVHPTFLYESICCLVIFIILYKIRYKRKYKGQLTCVYLFLYGLSRAIIENIRTDSLMLGNYRISQILSIFCCIIFGMICLFHKT